MECQKNLTDLGDNQKIESTEVRAVVGVSELGM